MIFKLGYLKGSDIYIYILGKVSWTSAIFGIYLIFGTIIQKFYVLGCKIMNFWVPVQQKLMSLKIHRVHSILLDSLPDWIVRRNARISSVKFPSVICLWESRCSRIMPTKFGVSLDSHQFSQTNSTQCPKTRTRFAVSDLEWKYIIVYTFIHF